VLAFVFRHVWTRAVPSIGEEGEERRRRRRRIGSGGGREESVSEGE
jgi:hypothetical protein